MTFDLPELQFLDVDGRKVAYRLRSGAAPTLLFLPGYASDMEGGKAVALDAFAAGRGVAMLRLDYSGTGSSGGRFEGGTLQLWLDETLATLDHLTEGPVIVVGSSMGGWIGLHLAMLRPDRVRSIVGIASAADFTGWGMTDTKKAELQAKGRLEVPNPYGAEPQIFTKAFWQSGQDLSLLGGEIAVDCAVRLIHGEKDRDVPVEVAFTTMRLLRSADVQLTIVKGGGHRLSEPHQIEAILRTVDALLEPA